MEREPPPDAAPASGEREPPPAADPQESAEAQRAAQGEDPTSPVRGFESIEELEAERDES